MLEYDKVGIRQPNRLLSAVAALALAMLLPLGCAKALNVPPAEAPAFSTQLAPAANRREPFPGTVSNSSQPELPTAGSTRDAILQIQEVPPAPDGFSFVFMGDSRNSSPIAKDGDATYRRTIDAINQSGARFAIHGGDFTFDNLTYHWNNVQKIHKKLRMPLLTVIGNHDTIAGRTFYESNFAAPSSHTGLDDYSFDYGGVRFISLDNANLTVTARQFDWLQEQLRTDLARIVLIHAPPSLGHWKVHGMKDTVTSARLVQILDQGHVSMVLISHIHAFDDSVRRGDTQYIVSGGAGAPPHDFGFGQPVHHLVLIQVQTGGGFSYRMVPVGDDRPL